MSVTTGKLDVLTLMSFTGLSEKRKLSRPGIAAPVALMLSRMDLVEKRLQKLTLTPLP